MSSVTRTYLPAAPAAQPVVESKLWGQLQRSSPLSYSAGSGGIARVVLRREALHPGPSRDALKKNFVLFSIKTGSLENVAARAQNNAIEIDIALMNTISELMNHHHHYHHRSKWTATTKTTNNRSTTQSF